MCYIQRLDEFNEEISSLKADDETIEQIRSILDDLSTLRELNEEQCNTECTMYEIFEYDSLKDYIMSKTGGSTIQNKKTVSHRSKNKNTKCQNCGGELSMKGNILICSKCGHESSTSRNTSSISDNYKHIQKQLNALVGLKTVNKKVRLLEPYLRDWILHRHYLRDWLTFTNTMDKWIKKYNRKNSTIDESYFNENLPAELEYDVIRLYIFEFHKMITYCSVVTKSTCNMMLCSPEEQLEVCREYAKDNYGKNYREVLIDGLFNYDGRIFELSSFFSKLAIKNYGNEMVMNEMVEMIVDDDIGEIMKIIGVNLSIPGLNFPFDEIIGISMKIPQVYTILQDFPFILNDVYAVPYVKISKKELDDIFNIIIDFNTYYKMRESRGQKYNSPMYHVVLRNVIMLNRYRKYSDIINFIPKKGDITTSKIDKIWIMYMSEHEELLKNDKATDEDIENELENESENELENESDNELDNELENELENESDNELDNELENELENESESEEEEDESECDMW